MVSIFLPPLLPLQPSPPPTLDQHIFFSHRITPVECSVAAIMTKLERIKGTSLPWPWLMEMLLIFHQLLFNLSFKTEYPVFCILLYKHKTIFWMSTKLWSKYANCAEYQQSHVGVHGLGMCNPGTEDRVAECPPGTPLSPDISRYCDVVNKDYESEVCVPILSFTPCWSKTVIQPSEFHFLVSQIETRISDVLCLSNSYDRNDNITVVGGTAIAMAGSAINKRWQRD